MRINNSTNRPPLLSRAATRVFGELKYVNRSRLAESLFGYSQHWRMTEEEKRIFISTVIKSALIQEKARAELGKDFSLWRLESGLKKTLTLQDLALFTKELNQALPGKDYFTLKDRLWKRPETSPAITQPCLPQRPEPAREILGSHGSESVTKREWQSNRGEYFVFYKDQCKPKLIRKENYDEQKANYKFLFGIEAGGEMVLISPSLKNKKKYQALLLNYEKAKLERILPPDETQAIIKFAELSSNPPYLSLFRARKALEMDREIFATHNLETAKAAIFCEEALPQKGLEGLKSKIPAGAFTLLQEYRELSAWRIPRPITPHQMQNFFGALEASISSLETVKLLLLDRLTRARFCPDKMGAQEIEELVSFAIPMAERNLFNKFKEELKDLFLLHNSALKYKKAALALRERIKMPREEAERELKQLAKDIGKITAEHLRLKPEDIKISWRVKSLKSISGKIEKGYTIEDCMGIKIVLNAPPPRGEEPQAFNLGKLKEIPSFVRTRLKISREKNRLEVPSKTGWQDYKIYFDVELKGEEIICEAIFQTGPSDFNASIRDLRQAHWLRGLNMTLLGMKLEEQKMDPLLPNRLLTGNPANNLKVGKNARQGVVDFFLLTGKDSEVLISNHLTPAQLGKLTLYAKTIEAGAIPADVVLSSRQMTRSGDIDPANPLGSIGKTLVYRFGRDADGNPVLIKKIYKKYPGTIKDGDILAFTKPEKKRSPEKLNEHLKYVEEKAIRPHSKFMAWLAKERMALKNIYIFKDSFIKEGEKTTKKVWEEILIRREASLAYFQKFKPAFLKRALQKVAAGFRFSSKEELFLAIGKGFIPRKDLQKALTKSLISDTWYFRLEEEGKKASIRTADNPEAIPNILSGIFNPKESGEDNKLVWLKASSSPEGLKELQSKLDFGAEHPLKEQVIALALNRQREEKGDGLSSPIRESIVLEITPDREGKWGNFIELNGFIKELVPFAHILSVDLPDNSSGKREKGILTLSIPEYLLTGNRTEIKELKDILDEHGVDGYCERF